MRRKIPILAVLGAAALLLAMPAAAQSISEGTITGTVYVSSGEVLPGVALTLKGPAVVTGQRTATSDAKGRFVFMSVPAGTYDLSAGLAGFKTVTETGVIVPRGSSVDVTFRMEIGSVEESITVTSVSPVIDTRSSTVSTTLGADLLAKVPTARNAFYDLSLTAPGMGTVGANESWLPSPTAYGSANSANITLVNGVNTTNPRGSSWGSLVTVNYNTVEEVKVLSLGTKAEYGNYSGAAIDVITKSGGNEFHGDAAYYTMVGDAADNSVSSFGDTWYYPDPQFDITTDPVDNWEASLTFGGPLVKDALWFYAGYGHPESETDTPLRPLNETWQADLYDLKLTGDFAANHRLWIGLHYEDLQSGNVTWGYGWDASMVYQAANENLTPQLQYQWVVGDSDIFGFKALMFDTDQTPSIEEVYGHPGYINWYKLLTTRDLGVNGDFPYVEAQQSERQTYQADWSHYAEDFLGEHDLKFGVQYTTAEGNWVGGYFQGYANSAYPAPWWPYGPAQDWWWNGPETWQWGTDDNPVWPMYNYVRSINPWLTVRESESTGAFFDDTWVINENFTVNVGLRYDQMTAKYGEGAVYEFFDTPSDVENPTVLRSREGSGNVFDWKVWSPRLGIAWTLTDDRKTVLRAHLGRYYAAMGVEALRRFGPDMEPGSGFNEVYFFPGSMIDLNGNGYWDPEETDPATRLLYGRSPDRSSPTVSDPTWFLEVEPGTGSPYADQFNISLQRQLGSDLALEFSYIYKVEKDFLALQPYNTETGEYFEWEELPFTTWTGYQTTIWQIVPKDYNGDGVINGNDYSWVQNHDAYRAVNAQDFAGEDVDRTYTGLQLVLNKRYSNRWQMLAALNWTKTDGFYPRILDQNWYIDGPMVMDTAFGSTKNHFANNLSGPALMTPEWAFKLSGSYKIPAIETDFGFRVRWDSGVPVWPVQSIPVYASWMGTNVPPGTVLGTGWNNETMVATDPNDPDWLGSTTIFDLSLSKTFRLGDVGQIAISFDALNAFNEDSPNQIQNASSNYGLVTSLVLPRTYRLGLKFAF